jgi:hypothetical protein
MKDHFPASAAKSTIKMDTIETISSQFRLFHHIEGLYKFFFDLTNHGKKAQYSQYQLNSDHQTIQLSQCNFREGVRVLALAMTLSTLLFVNIISLTGLSKFFYEKLLRRFVRKRTEDGYLSRTIISGRMRVYAS